MFNLGLLYANSASFNPVCCFVCVCLSVAPSALLSKAELGGADRAARRDAAPRPLRFAPLERSAVATLRFAAGAPV